MRNPQESSPDPVFMFTLAVCSEPVVIQSPQAGSTSPNSSNLSFSLCFQACVARKCYPSPLNYYNFPKSCCTSVNEVICHGIPDRRPLQDGDILNGLFLTPIVQLGLETGAGGGRY